MERAVRVESGVLVGVVCLLLACPATATGYQDAVWARSCSA
uniref:Carboxylesterase 3 n=2 Tax=Homininae TaxID=207598 RepID=H3BRE5_HUMAN